MSNTTINDIINASNKINAATKRGKAHVAWLTPEAAMAIKKMLEEAEKTNIRIELTKMLNN